MKSQTVIHVPYQLNYPQMPLLELTEHIGQNSDREALEELHNHRALFRYKDNETLLMADYLVHLKEQRIARQWCGYDGIALENAYDLTLDKFSNLPTKNPKDQPSPEIHGPDCRYYYMAFQKYATTRFRQERPASAVEQEFSAAKILQGMVIRHFHFSCLECRRQAQKLCRRYHWKINGHIVTVYLPTDMPVGGCRQWLQVNIPDVDPQRPGERDRVQAMVNQRLIRRRILSLHDLKNRGQEIPAPSSSTPFSVDQEISIRGLAGAVACEKAENIALQRPAIRTLGRDKLKQLIGHIFKGLVCGHYNEADLADRFGLSKATFSRFAGSRWSSIPGSLSTVSIPDLWLNTAQTLAGHAAFIEAARTADLWPRIEQIARNNNRTLGSETCHD